jgi:hypothetical protein
MDAAVFTPTRVPEVCTVAVPSTLPVAVSVKVTVPVGLELFAGVYLIAAPNVTPCPATDGFGDEARLVFVEVNCPITVSTSGCDVPGEYAESPLYVPTIELSPAHGKDAARVPAPGVVEVDDPKITAPRTTTEAALEPVHVTVSVSVMLPLGGAPKVQFTPAVNVTFCPITAGFGVESTLTTLFIWPRAGGANIASTSNRIKAAAARMPVLQVCEFMTHLTWATFFSAAAQGPCRRGGEGQILKVARGLEFRAWEVS